MEHNVVVRMAKVLYGMVLAVFVFNLLVLPLVPGYTMMAYEGMGMGHPSISSLMGTMRSLLGAGVPAWEILVVRPLAMLGGDWSGYGPEVWWSAAFFLGCGICTAVLLWQARCILSTIIVQTPFQRSNARSMKRAAASCWGIALLAAVGHALRFCLMSYAGIDIATASLCAAVVIGFGSLWLGRGIRCPMTVLYIPALLPMVPGIYAYKTVFALIMFLQSLNDPGQGLEYMQQFFLNATVSFSVIILLAAGATLPIFIFNRRAFSLTRRRRSRE